MAPAIIKHDYYKILGVEQTASPEAIARSWKNLAFKLHPDRNRGHNTTAAFQLVGVFRRLTVVKLGQAYATLKDDKLRAAYDRTCLDIIKAQPNSGYNFAGYFISVNNKIIAIQEAKALHQAQWHRRREAFSASITKLEEQIRKEEADIRNLVVIAAAERAEDSYRESWTCWLLSPITKQRVLTDEEKADKSRARQERIVLKALKRGLIFGLQKRLSSEQAQMAHASEAEDRRCKDDDEKISALLRSIITLRAQALAAAKAARREQERTEEELRKSTTRAHATTQQRPVNSNCLHDFGYKVLETRRCDLCPYCRKQSRFFLFKCENCPAQACPECFTAKVWRYPYGRSGYAGTTNPGHRPQQNSYSFDYDSFDFD